MLDKLKSKWSGIILVLIAVLAFSHWGAYRLGVRAEHDRITTFAVQLFNSSEEEALRQRVEFLRILSKHPPTFDMKDVEPYCSMTLALSESMEKLAIDAARKAGNDPEADRLQQQVDEARYLVTLVTGGRR